MSGRELGEALIRAGLEVEAVDVIGGEIDGPLVIGRVVDFVDEPQKNGKTIRWCQVDVGPHNNDDGSPRGIVCGALNFEVDDHVVVALPGTTLPGGFQISARKTYGHISDGMICAEDELGLGDDHTGIMVLGDTNDLGEPWVLGADALEAMRVRDEVLDMPVTPDMGYCLSIRGLAREAAQSLDVPFRDPLTHPTPSERYDGYPVSLETPDCSLFVALTVTGVDPNRPTPSWMAQRLAAAGMRSISLAVDISNYVMLETGQPNHCYDADALAGGIVVRNARPGEHLVTLDDVDRPLDPEDVVIADAAGPIGIAGVMGGENTELRDTTTTIVIEAANFDAVSIARASRRHKLSSEASRRFERVVDQNAAYPAARRVAALLEELAGGTLQPEETVAGSVRPMPTQTIDLDLPSRVLGMDVPAGRVIGIFEASGIRVDRDGDRVTLTPPSWRPDLVDPYDYVEEIGTKVGLENLPSVVPPAPVGRGLTFEQRARRAVTQALSATGFVEVLTFPFSSVADADAMGVDADDERRQFVELANPLADTAPMMRTSILPGLFAAVQRNTSRSNDDLALFEVGRVFFRKSDAPAPLPPVDRRPTQDEIAAFEEALPTQPNYLAGVLTGAWRPAGWRGEAVPASWQHAIAMVDIAARALGVTPKRQAVSYAPWHPGRCAEFCVDGTVIGHAGELHPTVCQRFGLPARTAAAEIDLDLLISLAPRGGDISPISTHPVIKEDVALVVPEEVTVADLTDALRSGAGELLESVRLFDIYRGSQVPEGHKSMAFALRFRAPDRTLKDADAAAARDAAVAVAEERFGAVLRA
jgi:phenylalanyl-tRNA synthetase beta chain